MKKIIIVIMVLLMINLAFASCSDVEVKAVFRDAYESCSNLGYIRVKDLDCSSRGGCWENFEEATIDLPSNLIKIEEDTKKLSKFAALLDWEVKCTETEDTKVKVEVDGCDYYVDLEFEEEIINVLPEPEWEYEEEVIPEFEEDKIINETEDLRVKEYSSSRDSAITEINIGESDKEKKDEGNKKDKDNKKENKEKGNNANPNAPGQKKKSGGGSAAPYVPSINTVASQPSVDSSTISDNIDSSAKEQTSVDKKTTSNDKSQKPNNQATKNLDTVEKILKNQPGYNSSSAPKFKEIKKDTFVSQIISIPKSIIGSIGDFFWNLLW